MDNTQLQLRSIPGISLLSTIEQNTVLRLSNRTCWATLSLFGAQVLEFGYHDEPSVFWLSPEAILDGSKAIRGGTPICWPWFGAAEKMSGPSHGYARTSTWQIDNAQQQGEEIELTLSFSPNELPELSATYRVKLTDSLELMLSTSNNGPSEHLLTEALHCYFNISDINMVTVDGIGQCRYFDKLKNMHGQTEEVVVNNPPIDRVFSSDRRFIYLTDRSFNRTIRLEKLGSKSTIIWNPGLAGAAALPDMPDQSYSQMLCIEPGNALEAAISLAAGETHKLGCKIDRLIMPD